MEVTVEMIKALRGRTAAGILGCKQALQDADGDEDRAEQLLREKGLAKVAKKSERETREGLVEAYIHTGSRLGALIEINCETDFVARTPELKSLAHELAMQVAAMPSTTYIDKSEIKGDDTRPPEEICLLEQAFIKDPSRTVGDVIGDVIAKVGENIRARRFSRFSLGE